MDDATSHVIRAGQLAALIMLDDLGLLAQMSDIELSKRLGIDRSNAWRRRKDVKRVRELRAQYMRILMAD